MESIVIDSLYFPESPLLKFNKYHLNERNTSHPMHFFPLLFLNICMVRFIRSHMCAQCQTEGI